MAETMATDSVISRYEIVNGQLRVHSPYAEQIVRTCRSWGGKFVNGCWVLPPARLAEVQERIGTHQEDLVQVEVGRDDWDDVAAQLLVGWHVLASRRGRDYGADLYAECVAGSIPSSGGSVKNPSVSPREGTRFRLWVPRDLALVRQLQIIDDPKAGRPAAEAKAADVSRVVMLMRDLGVTPEEVAAAWTTSS